MKHTTSSIARFARHVLGKPLYAYQAEVAEAVLASIKGGHGRIITVMMSRQAGKNQLSATLEAYLLMTMKQGTIVKAAPTFTPQIITSRLRLLSLLDTPLTRRRIWTSHGYIVGLAPRAERALLRSHTGPRVMFYSASPESSVVGATADLLLEIDEAQDVSPEKFDRDFRPMASTTHTTTILYGTAWSEHTLLARQRAINLEQEQRTGLRTHFEFDWRALAAINPAYRAFVEEEIARLGEDHHAIQTQFLLRPISGAGYLLSPLQRALLQGEHTWENEPLPDACYIAGMDVAGEDRAAIAPVLSGETAGRHKRDSSVLSIGRVTYNEWQLPCIEVVHQHWWTGQSQMQQYSSVRALVERWGIRVLAIDATGLGAGLTSMLLDKLGDERVLAFTFTRASKSKLAYQFLSLVNSGRVKLYVEQGAPRHILHECWQQLRLARYRLPAPQTIDIYVDPADGHDDFLVSLALLCEAMRDFSTPATSTLVQPRHLYHEEGRY